MCGLVGMAGDLTPAEEKVFRTLLILDSLRGEDSTGVASVGKHTGDVRIAKALGDPFQLFDTLRFESVMKPLHKVLIGHNRYATSGGVKLRNAHPFDMPTVVGVHNGTLTNKYKLLDNSKFLVDSENLYHHIDQKGLKDAIDVAEGAWALVWWDKVEESLNFLRNKERTLYFCHSIKEDVLFWASEPWMLNVALSRHSIKHTEVTPFGEDVHYSMHINEKGELLKPHLHKMIKAPPPPPPVYNGNVYFPPAFGVDTPKKPDEASQKPSGASYINEKGILLETLALNVDEHGNEYISCFDAKLPYRKIRLYHRSTDAISQFIGEDIIGDISSHVYIPGREGYYKVSPWSVSLALPQSQGLTMPPDLYPNNTGTLLSKIQWESVYHSCAWCTANLYAEDSNRFTTDNECLCPTCAVDEQVAQYVNFK